MKAEPFFIGQYSIVVTPEKYSIKKSGVCIAELPITKNVYSFLSFPLGAGKEMHVVTGGVGDSGSSMDDFCIIVVEVNKKREVTYASIIFRKNFKEVV